MINCTFIILNYFISHKINQILNSYLIVSLQVFLLSPSFLHPPHFIFLIESICEVLLLFLGLLRWVFVIHDKIWISFEVLWVTSISEIGLIDSTYTVLCILVWKLLSVKWYNDLLAFTTHANACLHSI